MVAGKFSECTNACIENVHMDMMRWLSEVPSEVRFWDDALKKAKDYGNIKLHEREFLLSLDRAHDYHTDIRFHPNDIIVDIGCGALPQYGNIMDGRIIRYYPMDPLAYEYSKLYKKYNVSPPVRPQFAVMEALSHFISGYVDYVICRNAMDHSIDAVMSLTECLAVTRIGGMVLLVHMDCEGEHGHYNGLHKWNITIRDGRLIFYNQKAKYNMSEMLSGFCDVALRRVKSPNPMHGGRDWIVAEIKKLSELPGELQTWHESSPYPGIIIQCLMKYVAGAGCLINGENLIPDDRRYIVFGTGKHGREALEYFGNKNGQIAYFIDNSVHDTESIWNGYMVKRPFLFQKGDGMVLIASEKYAEEMTRQLCGMGLREGQDFMRFSDFKLQLPFI